MKRLYLLLVAGGEGLDLKIGQQAINLPIGQLAAFDPGGRTDAFNRGHAAQRRQPVGRKRAQGALGPLEFVDLSD